MTGTVKATERAARHLMEKPVYTGRPEMRQKVSKRLLVPLNPGVLSPILPCNPIETDAFSQRGADGARTHDLLTASQTL